MKYLENIAEMTRNAERRAAVIYAKTDGKLYKWLRILYILSLCVTSLMGFFYCLGRHFTISEQQKFGLVDDFTVINKVKTSITVVLICSVIWLVCAIILKWKQEILSFILLVLSGAASIFPLIASSKNTQEFNSGINSVFWWRHFVPLCISLLFIVWMLYIKLRQAHRFNIAYTNMVNRIYKEFNKEDLTEDEWEKFLENYDPRAEEEKRRRNKKSKKAYDNIILEEKQ